MEGALIPGYKGLLSRCRTLREKAYMKAMQGLLEYYWDLGDEIHRALQDGKPQVGHATLCRLADDLGMAKTDLYNAVSFTKKFVREELSPRLSWSHYKALLPLEADAANTLARKADKKNLPVKALRVEVANVRSRNVRKSRGPKSGNSPVFRQFLRAVSRIPDLEPVKEDLFTDLDEERREEIRAILEAAEKKIIYLLKTLEI